jgi:hypothetical protein
VIDVVPVLFGEIHEKVPMIDEKELQRRRPKIVSTQMHVFEPMQWILEIVLAEIRCCRIDEPDRLVAQMKLPVGRQDRCDQRAVLAQHRAQSHVKPRQCLTRERVRDQLPVSNATRA